jgi:release factor glutamine methyltransferase
LVQAAPEWLRPGGWLLVEIGAVQGPAVRALFQPSLENVEVISDMAGRDRIVKGRLAPDSPA